jgi:exodeoxyribonuclease V alpha subunit
MGFQYGPRIDQELLPPTVILVDESSMIDIALMHDLLGALGPHTRIAFIGDANQLPPVGPGAPFRDYIATGLIPTVRLEKLYRAAAESWVCRNGPKVLTGGPLETDDIDDFTWFQIGEDEAEHIGDVIVSAINIELAAGKALSDVQVLSPMKIGECGTVALNAQLQPTFNTKGLRSAGWKIWDDVTLHVGDRVMQTKNDYSLGVFNGEVGTVAYIDGSQLSVLFEQDLQISYSREQARNLQLAYASTIHKVQGSQYDTVIMVCHSVHRRMLTRQLFYTGITRAQRKVVLVGDKQGLDIALRSAREDGRRTRLVSRISTGAA